MVRLTWMGCSSAPVRGSASSSPLSSELWASAASAASTMGLNSLCAGFWADEAVVEGDMVISTTSKMLARRNAQLHVVRHIIAQEQGGIHFIVDL